MGATCQADKLGEGGGFRTELVGAHWVEGACVACTVLSSAGKAQEAVAEAGREACQSYVRAVLSDGRAPGDQSSLCLAWQLCPGSSNLPLMVIDSGQPELEWQRVSRRREVTQVQEEESRAQRNSSEWTQGGGHSADGWATVMARARTGPGRPGMEGLASLQPGRAPCLGTKWVLASVTVTALMSCLWVPVPRIWISSD